MSPNLLARKKILSMLKGTLLVAMREDSEFSWLFKDLVGDKIPLKNREKAYEEAKRVLHLIEALEEVSSE
jgi:hypothetical protein